METYRKVSEPQEDTRLERNLPLRPRHREARRLGRVAARADDAASVKYEYPRPRVREGQLYRLCRGGRGSVIKPERCESTARTANRRGA